MPVTFKPARPPAKSRLRKLLERMGHALEPGEYRRDAPGNLVHIQPRKFRRGRIHWTKDGKQVGQFRWKFWTLKGAVK